MKQFCIVMSVFVMATEIGSVQTSAQSPARVIVSAIAAPLFLKPDTTITPLRLTKEGSVLNVLSSEGDWYRVEYNDPQWGRRVGYIEKRHVGMIAAPVQQAVDVTVPESKPRAVVTPTQPLPNNPESGRRRSFAEKLAESMMLLGDSSAKREREQREREQRYEPVAPVPDIATGGIMAGIMGGTAQVYRISVRKLDKDVYLHAASKTIIETRLCLEIASMQTNAVLNWAGPLGNSWIYFPDSQSKCDVVAVR